MEEASLGRVVFDDAVVGERYYFSERAVAGIRNAIPPVLAWHVMKSVIDALARSEKQWSAMARSMPADSFPMGDIIPK